MSDDAPVDFKSLTPKQAVEFFEQKALATGFNYQDVWQSQHQSSFTVAKAVTTDILQDIRDAVDAAIKNGTTYAEFQKHLTPLLQEKGWWGKQQVIDPLTGETVTAQLGSPRRLKLIYDTNLRTAHAEGQWQRIQANKASFPYLTYDGANSAEPRPQHTAWDRLTLPVDHPFWLSHMPCKAYGCKCRVNSSTAKQVEREGLTIGPAPEVEHVQFVNKRTGQVQMIPKGVDPSFHYPPGGRRASLTQALNEKLERHTPDLARASTADLVNGQTFSQWYQKPAGSFPLAYISPQVSALVQARTQLLTLPEAVLARQLTDQPSITQDDYALVQELLDDGERYQTAPNALAFVAMDGDQVLMLEAVQEQGNLSVSRLRRLTAEAAAADAALQALLDE
ncbi:MAG TPA: phage minor head protein [Pseudomonas sp.]|uniref:phage head morphogenesis protein n=1 Tax=Pseudomonas sp. TaxID=306 RepID=UPI002C9E3B5E|nr:phage minor head protein [Pseudomonas sp.]HWH86345.1 phage minor head protein [Pseudomonas sp.]